MQRPYPDGAASGPVQYGSGPRTDPQQDTGRRREVPFGPEISWPRGFRQLDHKSRDILGSAYGPEPVYQQPAMDDYGYGDPGYADPSYDGPRNPYPGSEHDGLRTPSGPAAFSGPDYRQPDARRPGYQVPEVRDSYRPGSAAPGYAAEGYDAPGYAAEGYDAQGYDAQGYDVQQQEAQQHEPQGYETGGYAAPGYQPPEFAAPPAGAGIYPVTGAPEALHRTGPQPLARPRATQDSAEARPDPRLQGMRYDELRYDEPSAEGRGHSEAWDDESWFEELRRSAPAYPETSPGQSFPAAAPRRAEPQLPGSGSGRGQQAGHGQQSGYRPEPAAERFGGRGPDRGGSGSPDRGGSGPQLSAGHPGGTGVRTGGQPVTGRGPWTGNQPAFLGAPTAQVGVLTPPAGTRIEDLRAGDPQVTSPFRAPATAGRPGAPAVRPGHGLDGPEITSSWPVQPPAEDADSFAEFWAEDDEDGDYPGLFGDRDVTPDSARSTAKRRIGRRRSGSNDHRLWLGLGAVVIVAAAAITGILKFEFPSHHGPAHTMMTPATIGTYMRTVDLERQTNVAQLRDEVIKMSSGQASLVKSAVYESGNSAAGNNEQIVMFIGGHLANADPATSVTSFTQKFPGAHVASAGALGGKAACVQEGSASDSVSMCAWFDNDSFGEIVSPTMNASALATEMLTVRPAVELVVKK
ncbi:MAG: hypothetical protein M3Z75_25045 [Actinomycetota bacterium]|nr:hypothetical protein [Actinomycetota bacterium]